MLSLADAASHLRLAFMSGPSRPVCSFAFIRDSAAEGVNWFQRRVMNRTEARLFHPAPGSAIAAARNFGIDLSLLAVRLRRTPEERLKDLEEAMAWHEQIRGAIRKAHGQAARGADPSSSE